MSLLSARGQNVLDKKYCLLGRSDGKSSVFELLTVAKPPQTTTKPPQSTGPSPSTTKPFQTTTVVSKPTTGLTSNASSISHPQKIQGNLLLHFILLGATCLIINLSN